MIVKQLHELVKKDSWTLLGEFPEFSHLLEAKLCLGKRIGNLLLYRCAE